MFSKEITEQNLRPVLDTPFFFWLTETQNNYSNLPEYSLLLKTSAILNEIFISNAVYVFQCLIFIPNM